MGSKGSAGEASIFRAKDGRWHGWITVGIRPDGKPDRRHRTAKTRAEVAAKVREFEVRRETGTITAVNTDTVEAWFRALADAHRGPTRPTANLGELRVDDPHAHHAVPRRTAARPAAARAPRRALQRARSTKRPVSHHACCGSTGSSPAR